MMTTSFPLVAAGVQKQATVIHAPEPIPDKGLRQAIFLAGSIEQGKATHWQKDFIEQFQDQELIILNPRRLVWDPTIRQSSAEPELRTQIEWELRALEQADCILMYFEPGTYSPITLLELGLFAKTGKLIVCCPEGYWRKANVDIVCEHYAVLVAESREQMFKMAERMLGKTTDGLT